ncbi:MAG: glutamate--tRNA ligase [Thermodesulfobacteriota bacterium]
MSKTITRFPPSPTGNLHIGGARTAIFNWLLARKNKGTFVLRIEDTDLERSTPERTKSILDAMHWLGLDYDQGPFFQSERFDLYRKYVQILLDKGQAYYCECTPEEVDQMREAARAKGLKPKYSGRCREKNLGSGNNRVVRLKMPLAGQTVFNDLVKGPISVNNSELDDLILQRADGVPTYNLAVVVDDITMGVTHILRGDDHINNTPRQVAIYHALDADLPAFAHVPMILGPDKKKLSKRHGATSVMEYKKQGFLPEALLNYLVKLGWGHGDQEIFPVQELISKFDIKGLGSSACVFDLEKLKWLNSHYIKQGDIPRLAGILAEHLLDMGHETDSGYLEKIIPLLQPRAKTMLEMAEMAEFFVYQSSELPYDPKATEKFLTPENKNYLLELADGLNSLTEFNQKNQEKFVQDFLEEKQIKFKNVAQPLRVAITGKTFSPGLFETMQVMGKEETVARIRNAVS